MPRRPAHPPLGVYLNNHPVGRLLKDPGGAVEFRYDEGWLNRERAIPVSLSLPLREDAYRGEPVAALFENLLPDSESLRRRVAEKVGARGTDAYSLLEAIGRDCVGALQFMADGSEPETDSTAIEGEIAGDERIESLLCNLEQAPLGLNREDDFRISVAGAQEKTALLRHDGKWWMPRGTTPTTHILKTQIGRLPGGIDLSNSVENGFYCLKLLEAFGLPVASADIRVFGETKALVIERFDRRWTKDGRLLRLPQEDCCQALSVPPTRKYQADGGPGLADILNLLKGSDRPAEDQKLVLKAHILFWLIGATDGHAKNFSLFLGPGGSYSLTPFYDVLTAQPSLDAGQIGRRQMKLAMSVGAKNHYRIDAILGRHFVQSVKAAGLPGGIAREAISEVMDTAEDAIGMVEATLPAGFPKEIHDSVKAAVRARLRSLAIDEAD